MKALSNTHSIHHHPTPPPSLSIPRTGAPTGLYWSPANSVTPTWTLPNTTGSVISPSHLTGATGLSQPPPLIPLSTVNSCSPTSSTGGLLSALTSNNSTILSPPLLQRREGGSSSNAGVLMTAGVNPFSLYLSTLTPQQSIIIQQ